jgi:Zn-dependent protease with chaperone function
MDFFQRQDDARRQTRTLLAYYSLAIVCIIAALYLATLFILSGMGDKKPQARNFDAYSYSEPSLKWWQPEIFIAVSGGTLFLIFLGWAFKRRELSGGGSAVAAMLGGVPVPPQTRDPSERKLLNVVEEMAIASGTPVPQVFLLPESDSINAFAAGYDHGDMAIGVTRGCCQMLTRDELQGVIAHEFSHILHNDMQLNMRVTCLLNGILCLALTGYWIFRGLSRGRQSNGNSKGGGAIVAILLLAVALIVIGYVGVFFASLIRAAISRQREYLADASAVQFTRNPGGLAGALKKIAGLHHGGRITSAHASEAGHFFFANGIDHFWESLFATHPPLIERILAVDPHFDGSVAPAPQPETHTGPASAFAPQQVIESAGQVTTAHLDHAAGILDSLPPALAEGARQPDEACAILFALLLSTDSAVLRQQLALLQHQAPAATHQPVQSYLPLVRGLPRNAFLPLAELLVPALRQLSPNQYTDLKKTVRALVDCDAEIDLFESTLLRMMQRHLDRYFEKTPPTVVRFHSLQPLLPDILAILSTLARAGHEDPSEILKAFQSGTAQLNITGMELALPPEPPRGSGGMHQALERCAQALPVLKKNILYACAHTVAADNRIQEKEGELLRAVAESLDCPLPPFLDRLGGTSP